MRSVGLDLGAKEVAFCEVSNGAVVARQTVHGLAAIEELLGETKATVAIEACREAWHVHDVLTAKGHEVLMVDTTRAKQIGIGHHGRKTDKLDAEVLARAVERGGIPLAHVLSPHRRQLREKVLARRLLVDARTRFIVTIRGIARSRGERLGGCDSEDFIRKVASSSLSAPTRAAIAPMVAILEVIQAQLSHVESELEQLAAQEPAVRQLTTAPGVDLVVASSFVAVVDEAKRFSSAHKLQSYLGIVPRENSSGSSDKHRLGAISKCGNTYARTLLVQGAWTILRSKNSDPLAVWARGVAKRRGNRIAVVALARRLSGVLWAMWRHNRPYDPMLVGNASARGHELAAVDQRIAAGAIRIAATKAAMRTRKIRARLHTGRKEVAHS